VDGVLSAVLAVLDGEVAVDHVEQFVGVLVGVPDELAVEARDLHVLAVQFREQAWLPRLLDGVEGIRQRACVHAGDW